MGKSLRGSAMDLQDLSVWGVGKLFVFLQAEKKEEAAANPNGVVSGRVLLARPGVRRENSFG